MASYRWKRQLCQRTVLSPYCTARPFFIYVSLESFSWDYIRLGAIRRFDLRLPSLGLDGLIFACVCLGLFLVLILPTAYGITT